MSGIEPKTSTGSNAFVFEVIAASIRRGSICQVSGSMSTKTGRAPSNMMLLLDAMNENGVVTTSSPAPTPSDFQIKCKPDVPLLHAIACLLPIRRLNACSNSGTRGPRLNWWVFKTATTASISACEISGAERLML